MRVSAVYADRVVEYESTPDAASPLSRAELLALPDEGDEGAGAKIVLRSYYSVDVEIAAKDGTRSAERRVLHADAVVVCVKTLEAGASDGLTIADVCDLAAEARGLIALERDGVLVWDSGDALGGAEAERRIDLAAEGAVDRLIRAVQSSDPLVGGSVV